MLALNIIQAEGQPRVGKGEEIDRERTDSEQRRVVVAVHWTRHDARREGGQRATPALLGTQQPTIEHRLGGKGFRGVEPPFVR